MKFEDEAFVYLWQDGRQKPYRYYLGYHKGNPDDSYTHSSSVFESFSKDSIPDGVKRRVIATGSAEEMMELENKLLKNRKGSRKWDRYYNVITIFPPYMWEDPAFREMQSKSTKKQWEDSAFREKMSEKMKKQNKKLWADPAFREMITESSKKLWEDPAFREMKSKSSKKQMKKQWEDPAFREMQSKSSKKQMKKQWEDPAFREKMGAKWKDPAYREMHSEKMKKQNKKLWEDPAYREMMTERRKKLWEDPAFREMMTEKHTCTVCGFVAVKGNIARWHNDNCKHKNPLHELTEDDK